MRSAEESILTEEGAPLAADKLVAFATGVLVAHGVPAADAGLVADSLVKADLWGHQSHGLMRLSWYADKIRAGSVSPVTEAALVSETGPVAVLDGNNGLGQVLAARAAQEALDRAESFGVGAVGVRNSNHFGTAAYFTRMGPPKGCISLLMTNTSPVMAPWGGLDRVLGNNPWSIAAPGGGGRTVVMDLSNSAVARGKVYLARQRGEQIPSGWALTREGEATTDPSAAIDGFILPMAGPKGYVISLMMDVLAGVLTGSSFAKDVAGPYQPDRPGRVGHLYIALRVSAFLGLEEFHARMQELVEVVKGVPLAQGSAGVFYPGELEDENERNQLRTGIVLPQLTRDALARLSTETGVRFS